MCIRLEFFDYRVVVFEEVRLVVLRGVVLFGYNFSIILEWMVKGLYGIVLFWKKYI